jgi:hypothetical protein
MTPSLVSRSRHAVVAAVLAVLALTTLMAAAPAMAKAKSCADQVVDDWYGDGRLDKIYPLHCYREALSSLPLDIKEYSNAAEVIQAALFRQTQGRAGDPDDVPIPLPPGVKPASIRNTSLDVRRLLLDRAPTTNTAGPSSVPIPLLVLAGLAGLLLIAGGAGYAARRFRGNGGGDDGGEPPPAI